MIIIDCREKLTDEHKKIFNNNYETKQLDIGDYIISVNNKIIEIIERKSYSDLISSINDGRLIKQIKELKETLKDYNDTKIWIAITSDNIIYPDRHISILRNICYSYKINFIKFNSKEDFYKELEERNNHLEKYMNKDNIEKIVKGGNSESIENIESIDSLKLILLNDLKIKKNKINKNNILSILLSFIPGISIKSSINISSLYSDNLKNFVNSIDENKISELIEIFGKKIINKTVIDNIRSIFID